MKLQNHNNNCEGEGNCVGDVVKVLPIGGEGNAILCFKHFMSEMIFRQERNLELRADCQFSIPLWKNLKTYSND